MNACFWVLLMAVARSSFGQALPAAEASPISTGFELPTTAGTLNYAVSVGETLNWGYYTGSGAVDATNLSGDLGYISEQQAGSIQHGSGRWPFLGHERLLLQFCKLGAIPANQRGPVDLCAFGQLGLFAGDSDDWPHWSAGSRRSGY